VVRTSFFLASSQFWCSNIYIYTHTHTYIHEYFLVPLLKSEFSMLTFHKYGALNSRSFHHTPQD
jgi:hypothetical protein